MASEALLLLLKLNLAGAAAIVLVLMLRAAIRDGFGARVAYALWLVVPAAVAAAMLPARQVVVAAAAAQPALGLQAMADERVAPALLSMDAPLDPLSLVMAVWLTGVVLALALLTWRQAAFTRSLGRLRREAEGVVRAEAAGIGPAIIGALRPKLVLPRDFEARFDEAERDIVLAHERVHLKGGDPLINAIVALAQCICWFNPLAHLAAHLIRIDQELACDAAVIAQFPKARRRYGEAMLKTQFAAMSLPLGCYWPARAADPLKQRIAMLKRDLPDARRAACGGVVAALITLTSGCAAWVVQPARTVEAGAEPASSMQVSLNTDLLRAVWSADFPRAEKALASGADPNAQTAGGLTALAITARKEDMRMLNLLLKHGADVNLASRGEGNALMAGAKRGHVYAVARLVEHGAEINAIAPRFGTPLAAAVRTGHWPVVKYLVEHGADVNLASPRPAPWDVVRGDGMLTPLQFAIDGGQPSIAAYLKSRGATM